MELYFLSVDKTFQDLTGFFCIYTGLNWVLPSFTGFYWDKLCFTRLDD